MQFSTFFQFYIVLSLNNIIQSKSLNKIILDVVAGPSRQARHTHYLDNHPQAEHQLNGNAIQDKITIPDITTLDEVPSFNPNTALPYPKIKLDKQTQINDADKDLKASDDFVDEMLRFDSNNNRLNNINEYYPLDLQLAPDTAVQSNHQNSGNVLDLAYPLFSKSQLPKGYANELLELPTHDKVNTILPEDMFLQEELAEHKLPRNPQEFHGVNRDHAFPNDDDIDMSRALENMLDIEEKDSTLLLKNISQILPSLDKDTTKRFTINKDKFRKRKFKKSTRSHLVKAKQSMREARGYDYKHFLHDFGDLDEEENTHKSSATKKKPKHPRNGKRHFHRIEISSPTKKKHKHTKTEHGHKHTIHISGPNKKKHKQTKNEHGHKHTIQISGPNKMKDKQTNTNHGHTHIRIYSPHKKKHKESKKKQTLNNKLKHNFIYNPRMSLMQLKSDLDSIPPFETLERIDFNHVSDYPKQISKSDSSQMELSPSSNSFHAIDYSNTPTSLDNLKLDFGKPRHPLEGFDLMTGAYPKSPMDIVDNIVNKIEGGKPYPDKGWETNKEGKVMDNLLQEAKSNRYNAGRKIEKKLQDLQFPCIKCDRAGTDSCDRFSGTCTCSAEYMGEKCDMPRNACEEGHNQRAGNMECGEGVRGICVPVIGTDRYNCDCFPHFEDNPETNIIDCVASKDSPPPMEFQPREVYENPHGILDVVLLAFIVAFLTVTIILVALMNKKLPNKRRGRLAFDKCNHDFQKGQFASEVRGADLHQQSANGDTPGAQNSKGNKSGPGGEQGDDPSAPGGGRNTLCGRIANRLLRHGASRQRAAEKEGLKGKKTAEKPKPNDKFGDVIEPKTPYGDVIEPNAPYGDVIEPQSASSAVQPPDGAAAAGTGPKPKAKVSFVSKLRGKGKSGGAPGENPSKQSSEAAKGEKADKDKKDSKKSSKSKKDKK